MRASTRLNPFRQPPQGYLYLSVLCVAFLVSLVTLSGLHLARLQLQLASHEDDHQQAHLLAQSAIEHAIAEFNTNANWQSDYQFGTEYPSPPVSVNDGTFCWQLVDLGEGRRRLDGIGRCGPAECRYSVELGVSSSSVLDFGLICHGDFGTHLPGSPSSTQSINVVGAPLHTNATAFNMGRINANLEARAINNSGIINGTQTVPSEIRQFPDPQSVFAYYETEGTWLDNRHFPPDKTGTRSMSSVLLSPYHNPFGTPNPHGIYVLDLQNTTLNIASCRIVGTLVIKNVRADGEVRFDKEVNVEPAYPNFPSVLVDGNLLMRFSHYKLPENGNNFNPPGTPFQGKENTATDDEYPSGIAGIVYCSGNLIFDGKNDALTQQFQGAIIVGGSCYLDKTVSVSIQYDPAIINPPPPGFGAGNPQAIVKGSWRQTANP